jgi:hypothetical protein
LFVSNHIVRRIVCAGVASLAGVAICCNVTAQSPPLFTDKKPIPKDAIVLFDGKDLSQWTNENRKQPVKWKIKKGYAQVQGGGIVTKQQFSDYQLHVEFWIPLMAKEFGQSRANSGVFMIGDYEIQVLDSYGFELLNNGCGSIYSVKAALVNACRPPRTWQTYDIVFHAPRFDANGKKIANARITAFQNGVLIHDNDEIPYPTAAHGAHDVAKGPIYLQDHGNPVRYRDIWIRPLGPQSS